MCKADGGVMYNFLKGDGNGCVGACGVSVNARWVWKHKCKGMDGWWGHWYRWRRRYGGVSGSDSGNGGHLRITHKFSD